MTAKKRSQKAVVQNPVQVDVEQRDKCFVISPFGGWFDVYYKNIFDPAIRAAGLDPCRADDLYRPSSIIHDIWSYVRKAKLLVADLTGKNQNVLYELGLAHAIGKPVVMVTQVLEDVPFDLRNLRVITYDLNDPAWAEDLRSSLERSLKEVIQAPQNAVPPAFLKVEEVHAIPRVSPLERKVMELSQEVDSLRRSRVSREGFDRVLDPSEAREQIDRYLSAGMPTQMIVERLQRRGVPSGFVRQEIDKIKSRSKSHQDLTSEDPSISESS